MSCRDTDGSAGSLVLSTPSSKRRRFSAASVLLLFFEEAMALVIAFLRELLRASTTLSCFLLWWSCSVLEDKLLLTNASPTSLDLPLVRIRRPQWLSSYTLSECQALFDLLASWWFNIGEEDTCTPSGRLTLLPSSFIVAECSDFSPKL